MLLRKFFICIVITFVLSGCERKTILTDTLITFDKSSSGSGKLMEDSINKGHYFNRMDSTSQYGFKYVYYLKKEDFNKPIRLILTGKVRTNHVHSTGAITYVLVDSTTVVNWNGSNLTRHVTDLNTWCKFEEVVNLNKSDSWGRYTRIEFQGLLGDPTHEVFDLDSIKIKLIRFD